MKNTKKIISLEVSDELYRAIKLAAFEADKSTSALIRTIVTEQLASKFNTIKG